MVLPISDRPRTWSTLNYSSNAKINKPLPFSSLNYQNKLYLILRWWKKNSIWKIKVILLRCLPQNLLPPPNTILTSTLPTLGKCSLISSYLIPPVLIWFKFKFIHQETEVGSSGIWLLTIAFSLCQKTPSESSLTSSPSFQTRQGTLSSKDHLLA